jgi:hypothetical protein
MPFSGLARLLALRRDPGGRKIIAVSNNLTAPELKIV